MQPATTRSRLKPELTGVRRVLLLKHRKLVQVTDRRAAYLVSVCRREPVG